LSKLIFFSALALFLMVADVRFQMMQPLRTVLATVIYPFQWLAMRPVLLVQVVDSWANSLAETEADREVLRTKLTLQSQRALQVDQLTLEIADCVICWTLGFALACLVSLPKRFMTLPILILEKSFWTKVLSRASH
jgi:hypothetical protein